MKNLYISDKIALRIGPALQELVERRATEVLPALDNIFLEGFESLGRVQKGIGQFVAARQVASHPVAVSHWANSEKDKKCKKWHECQMCSKAFTTSSHLWRHTFIHTGERVNECPFPGCECATRDLVKTTFSNSASTSHTITTSSHLSRHTLIHTGEWVYECPFPGCKCATRSETTFSNSASTSHTITYPACLTTT